MPYFALYSPTPTLVKARTIQIISDIHARHLRLAENALEVRDVELFWVHSAVCEEMQKVLDLPSETFKENFGEPPQARPSDGTSDT